MKNKTAGLILLIAAWLLFAGNLFAAILPDFVPEDRVLILAPHPDDETIGAAGLIQKALKANAKVKVVCFTNGDNNELSFIVYEKRLTFKKGEFLHMGEVRHKETVNAMSFLGLKPDDLIFLGYPDFGTMEILTKYWGDVKPFRSMLTRVSSVPYKDCLSYGASYSGESILNDLKKVLLDFAPTKVFVSHPVDSNRDHRSLYVFLRVALWDLDGKMSETQIIPYLIHDSGWPKPRGYHSELGLFPPRNLMNSEIAWQFLKLNNDETIIKNRAVSFYESQIKYSPKYLYSFVRKNELFGDYPIIVLKPQNEGTDYWFETQRKNAPLDNGSEKNSVPALAYEQKNNNLLIKMTLKKHIDKDFWSSIFLLGYKRSEDFSDMPKLRLDVTTEGLRLRDKKKLISGDSIKVEYFNSSMILTIPEFVLGNPDYVLSCVRVNSKDLPYYDTAWRIIELE
jgi:LmbE family N-acetylglucosaminyl deacetylase